VSAILLILTVGNKKVQGWGDLQRHNVRTKYAEHRKQEKIHTESKYFNNVYYYQNVAVQIWEISYDFFSLPSGTLQTIPHGTKYTYYEGPQLHVKAFFNAMNN
jgi:hypothetical protein